MIEIKTSYGELVDKLSILKVKQKMISNEEKLKKIVKELEYVSKHYDSFKDDFVEKKLLELFETNEKLWGYEDRIRRAIKENNFDKIIECSMLICRTNDYRFELKNEINNHLNSSLFEVKEHIKY
jgi:hypothetical protein